jgi:pimeloyl-ACP methyl ester carboxylesterase
MPPDTLCRDYAEIPVLLPSAAPQLPRPLPWLRLALRFALTIFPRASQRWLYELWFTPMRSPVRDADLRALGRPDEAFRAMTESFSVLVRRFGQGPQVLLVHGWGGYGAQFSHLVGALNAAGYAALVYDLPGHGENPRGRFHAGHSADLIEAIAAQRRLHAIVGHSLGAYAAGIAIARGVPTQAFVGLAPPANLKTLLLGFQRLLMLPQESVRRLGEQLEREFGPEVWCRFSLDYHMPRVRVPTLLIHDKDDRVAAWQTADYLAGMAPDVKVQYTKGLGHYRILRHAPVLDAVVRHLASRSAAAERASLDASQVRRADAAAPAAA